MDHLQRSLFCLRVSWRAWREVAVGKHCMETSTVCYGSWLLVWSIFGKKSTMEYGYLYGPSLGKSAMEDGYLNGDSLGKSAIEDV